MISEFFLNIIFKIVSGMLSVVPDITFSVDTSAFQYFVDILRVACYMLPMGTVGAIVGIIVGLAWLRIQIAIVRTIWDLLPLV